MRKTSMEIPCLIRGMVFLFFLLLGIGNNVNAQVKEKLEIPSLKEISDFENTTFCVSMLCEEQMYAFRNVKIAEVSKIRNMAFNPTGSSIAIMSDRSDIAIYSFREQNKLMFKLKDGRKDLKTRQNLPFALEGDQGKILMKAALKGKVVPLAMCYAPDARRFVSSNSLGEVIVYDTRDYSPVEYIQLDAPATLLTMSSNNYFIAAACDVKVDIWNFQTKTLRTSMKMSDKIVGLEFSPDASYLAVLTNKRLTVYDTRTWQVVRLFDYNGGQLASLSFHPYSKYVSVVADKNRIVILNLKNGKIEQYIDDTQGSIYKSRFVINQRTQDVCMLSNRMYSMVFWDANGLNPFYGKVLSDRLIASMNEWGKMMEGESMEEYSIRVNEENRIKQQQLFAQEIATELAGDRLAIENPFVDNYDANSGNLSISFSSMPSISLKVPESEAANLMDVKNLKFENPIYVLNDEDEFEVAYVEVRDEISNKVYIFDNIGRLKMLAMEDFDFVPLEIMQQISQEEVQLKEIKEQVVTENKEEQLISDNTQIDVKTEVLPSVDSNGQKILNYKVSYQYEVINRNFSTDEDFPSGDYNIKKSNAAMSLMKIIKNAFEGDFAKYLSAGKQVKVIITGSADASPIRGRIAYKGQYGEFINEPYYKEGNLDNISVTKTSGITSNEQLALMRAAGVKDYVEKNVTTLGNTKNEYEYHVEVAKERGGEFRKINVGFVIIDAFPIK